MTKSELVRVLNASLLPNWKRRVRFCLVTPYMHRIHHSALQLETDSNYGFSLSCWDRLFKKLLR
ncbi:MAG: hypothetical protein LUQ68_07510 [Methylococcaceae bacterium]|nr:hypothetical protein [Methylococcaceae bacterium]OYV22225.1 MAG: fatty acid hydroxylase [Methylococcaceae bacterium NSO1]